MVAQTLASISTLLLPPLLSFCHCFLSVVVAKAMLGVCLGGMHMHDAWHFLASALADKPPPILTYFALCVKPYYFVSEKNPYV